MTTETPARLLTAEEFWHLPDPPHGGKMELVCGKVVIHMPVGGPHGHVAGRLIIWLGVFVLDNGIGSIGPEVGFILGRSPDIVRAPDAYFVRKDRLESGHMPRAFFDGYPDLAIEVTSPDDSDLEVTEKLQQYLAAGTPRVWIVRPESKTVTVHRPDGTARTLGLDAVLTSDDAGFAVDGLALKVGDIFE